MTHPKRALSLTITALILTASILGMSDLTGQATSLNEYFKVSREPRIIQALQCLEQTSAKASVQDILTRHVRIMFKNMAEIGPAYQSHDALSWITDDDEQVIFINMKHVNAPPQAIAAIISHEALHGDRDNSLQEELKAWQREEKTWQEMLTLYPALKTVRIGQIPLVDRENAIAVLEQRNQLAAQITGNIAYQGLPEHSPGY